MTWMELVADCAWPFVTLVAVLRPAKPVSSWFQQRPLKTLAASFGPAQLNMEWDSQIAHVLGVLPASSEPRTSDQSPLEPSGNRVLPPPPTAVSLRFREQAKNDPTGAIIEAWGLIQSELIRGFGIAVFGEDASMVPPLPSDVMFADATRLFGLAPWLQSVLKTLHNLRKLAVSRQGVSSEQAFEFLALTDIALNELRRVERPHSLSVPPTADAG
ncbi:hypothetical protein ABZ894_30880 [Nocardia beijingensis]|uniref:hypothetical protein n=1 Tax=Nocardia beijingensis TaxID=95162 RepID=UPI0033F16E17